MLQSGSCPTSTTTTSPTPIFHYINYLSHLYFSSLIVFSVYLLLLCTGLRLSLSRLNVQYITLMHFIAPLSPLPTQTHAFYMGLNAEELGVVIAALHRFPCRVCAPGKRGPSWIKAVLFRKMTKNWINNWKLGQLVTLGRFAPLTK